jgi:hypothetical protein
MFEAGTSQDHPEMGVSQFLSMTGPRNSTCVLWLRCRSTTIWHRPPQPTFGLPSVAEPVALMGPLRQLPVGNPLLPASPEPLAPTARDVGSSRVMRVLGTT